MIFVPISFVVALFLISFLIRIWREDAENRPAARPFLLLLVVMTIQSIVVGLRWGYGMVVVMPLMSVLAASIPPLSFLAFRSLTDKVPNTVNGYRWHDWPHALPVLLLLVLNMAWGAAIDVALILTYLGYGLTLFWLARLGPDGLSASRMDGALRSYRSLQLTATALMASGCSDIFISLDFAFEGGRHVPVVVSGFMVLVLMALGFAASLAEGGSARDNGDGGGEIAPASGNAAPSDNRIANEDDARIAEALEAMMQDKLLYKDVELNLGKLARRMGLPVRAVSNAINRVHGISVSQYVNNFRVAEACRLLAETQQPITAIVFESGFMTKSNFNREFLRVTDKSPSAWRNANRPV